MTSMDLELVDLTSIVGDWELPCEYAGDVPTSCKDDPARWILHLTPCCAGSFGVRLACDLCKEKRLMDAFAVECEHCGHVFEHAPEAYTLIEPLERK